MSEDNSPETGPAKPENEFAYTESNRFTAEIFKVHVRNLPNNFGMGEFKKFLKNKLQLDVTKVKAPKTKSSDKFAYICFRSQTVREEAVKLLNDTTWKGCKLWAGPADPSPDPFVQKRNHENSQKRERNNKKPKTEEVDKSLPLEVRLKNKTVPYWQLEYDEQIATKQKSVKNFLKSLGHKIVSVNPNLRPWLENQQQQNDGLCCELWPMRYPEVSDDGYRNKCEFSIGINEETGERTVGFRVDSYSAGSICVAPINNIPTVPNSVKSAVDVFQKFIRQSDLPPYNPVTHEGYWKQLTIRYATRTDELMLIIHIHLIPDGQQGDVKQKLVTFYETDDNKCFTSLYLRIGKDNKEIKTLHLLGDTYIHELLNGFKFRISCDSFFQVHTPGAEIAYNTIAELAALSGDVSVLDVCCGTGTIGISLSNKCKEVLGLDDSEQAIEDAQFNAKENNVTNTTFFTGKAEDILLSVAYRATGNETVAVIDPPRAGLHKNGLLQLRKTKQINKLIFMACDYKQAETNFINLARGLSKIYRGSPFVPVKAVAVDLFPHTDRFELIILFERYEDKS